MSKESYKGSVVVTGTSTGIGRSCALYLSRLGFKVFAAVRKETDGDSINEASSGKIKPVLMDLLDHESIRAGAKKVEDELGGQGLSGLVNNAGIAVAGPLEVLPLARLEEQLKVNVVGQVAVTQAFLPLLRRGKGRVINIGSDNGKAAWPYLGAYCASKHAIEALSDSLRMELMPWGIKVILIEPGSIKTAIWGKSKSDADALVSGMSEEGKKLYGHVIPMLYKVSDLMEKTGIEPESVASVAALALTSSHPRARYVVGIDAKAQILAARLIPTWIRDRLIMKAIDYLGK